MKAFSCSVGIFLFGYIRVISGRSHILNVYAPYKEREGFWDTMEVSGILNAPSLIFPGDLNSTLGTEEMWGESSVVDRMEQRLRENILSHNLIDVFPPKNAPTWDNGRSGNRFIAKRLDRFIFQENMIEKMGDVRSFIIENYVSDHRPITLIWHNTIKRFGFPFKLNRIWLEDLNFDSLI